MNSADFLRRNVKEEERDIFFFYLEIIIPH
jgi:hypothetical protein